MGKINAEHPDRNWPLVVVSSILIVIGLIFLLLALVYVKQLGWASLGVGLTGVSVIGAAVMSIVKNDPSWILLELLLQ